MSYSLLQLDGKVAVIVGGTSGIGLAIAKGMAEAGADAVPTSRRMDMVEAAATEIEQRGRRSIRVTSDVSDRASLENVLAETVRAFGKVDILVNSAGRTKRAPTLEFTEEDWNAIIDTNLTGMLRACQSFYEPLKASRHGRVVNIASLASFVAWYDVVAYNASKMGVLSLTQTLAIEWARDNIAVNAIAPGVIPTELNRAVLHGTDRGREILMRTPMGRFGKPEEVGGAAVFLASDAVSFITGTTLIVDGGYLASGVNT